MVDVWGKSGGVLRYIRLLSLLDDPHALDRSDGRTGVGALTYGRGAPALRRARRSRAICPA
jgi:hypothetical protein